MGSMKANQQQRALTRVALVVLGAYTVLATPLVVANEGNANLESSSVSAPQPPMEIMVVTASGFERKLVDAPASVTVVTREELQNKPYAGLADALRDIEGIDVGSGQDKNGNISITMRGLPASYTLILVDGRRQSDVGNIGPNNFGNSQFMYMPPLEAIERIEVVRGPMSTLYGADAIGGVVNIITRKSLDSWHGSVTLGGSWQEDSQYGNDGKADLYLTGPLLANLNIAAYGSFFNRGSSEPGYETSLPLPDGTTWQDSGSFADRKIVAAKNHSAGLQLGWQPNDVQYVTLGYDNARQRYNNTQGQVGTLDAPASLWRASNGQVQPRVGYTPYQRVERKQWVLAHQFELAAGILRSDITRSRSANLGRSLPLTLAERAALQQLWDSAVAEQNTPRPQLTEAIAAQLSSTFLPRPERTLEIDNTIVNSRFEGAYGNHAFIVGGQWFHADMEDGVFAMSGEGVAVQPVQAHKQWALFAEDNWDVRPDIIFTYGLRYDHHSVFGSQTSPRVYLNWRTNSDFTIKGGISTGYKAPEPNQLFPGIVGFGGQGVSPMVGSPHLQPETSINYEIAAYYHNGNGINANLTLFVNDFKDKIINQSDLINCELAIGNEPCVNIGEGWAELGYTRFSQAQNVDKARTQGVEIAAGYDITRFFTTRFNYTYTDSEVRSGRDQGLPLVNTPKHMLNVSASYQLSDRWSTSLQLEARGERYRGVANVSGPTGPEAQKLYYKAYELVHLSLQYKATEALRLNFRVNNLLDNDLSSRSCYLAESAVEYVCSPDYNTTERARSLWLSASYQF